MVDAVTFPIPISHIQGRYLIFDINAIAYLREHHRICGVFIGTLPQNPSQNVFMGLPMEIMPEEAQVLIDEAVCYILDDPRAHDIALARAKASRQRQSLYVKEHKSHAAGIAEEKAREKELDKRRALKRVKAKQGIESMGSSTETVTMSTIATAIEDNDHDSRRQSAELDDAAQRDSLFDTSSDQLGGANTSSAQPTSTNTNTLTITPATSTILLPSPSNSSASASSSQTKTLSLSRHIPNLHRPSYTLYKHLNSHGYFQTPGLRFGCQFCVYPGDPLRFHSHFLAVGYGWDEEIDLMDIVGGGRLGTGVKKGWLVGGREKGRNTTDEEEGRVRTWSVEWAGM